MTLLQGIKLALAIAPQGRDDAAFASNVLDKRDFDNAKGVAFVAAVGHIDAANTGTVVKQSASKSDATTLGGTPETVLDVTEPAAGDDDSLAVLAYVPMDKWTERYLQFQSTAGDGSQNTELAVIAIADRIGEADGDAAALGVGALDVA